MLNSETPYMTRVGNDPTTYGLKVPATAKTYSAILSPTECERPGHLSVHVPKRPTRNAPPCQSHVSRSHGGSSSLSHLSTGK